MLKIKIELFMLLILLLMLKTLNATTIQASTVNDLNGKTKCERITMSYCQGLGYNLTMMPNLAGHADIKDANLMVSRADFSLIFDLNYDTESKVLNVCGRSIDW